MDKNQNNRSRWGFADTATFLVDAHGAPLSRWARWLRDAGVQDVRPLSCFDELPRFIRERWREGNPGPSLMVVSARRLDDTLLERCRPFFRLIEAGWLGIILVVDNQSPDPGVTRRALDAGCLDIQYVPEETSGDAFLPRLHLAFHVLQERHRRTSQAREFQTQLAERRVMEARLNHIACHDELTDLANRSTFERALDLAIEQGKHKRITNTVLYLDLDRFKLHNDAAGHGAGNLLLQQVANHLRGVLPSEYLLARLGSDEFAVLLQGSDDREAAEVAERLRRTVSEIEPDGHDVVYHVGVSIGYAVIGPGSVGDASQALARAEQACFVAKSRGGNSVHRFCQEEDVLQHLREDMHWAQPIREALRSNRLFLTFQPILSVADACINHYEALARIPKSLGGDDRSARFMLAAERLGLAQQVDLYVVSKAIDFLAGHRGISLGVNLSSHAFQEPALLPLLRASLHTSRIAPERLVFEITETAAVMNFAATRRMIDEMRSLGCRFALDDFGSGFSSYSYIKQFPIDMLKIDGSFIVGMRSDPRDQAIVQSMVDIAHSLDKEVVAEFVQDAETLRLLVAMGIDYAQGHYVGRPTRHPTVRQFDRETEGTQ